MSKRRPDAASATTETAQPPVNELDPALITADERRKIPLLIKIYGALCILSGVATLPSVAWFFGVCLHSLASRSGTVVVSDDLKLSVGLVILGVALSAVGAVVLIAFGISLIKSNRRNAALLSYVLIAYTFTELVIDVMLQGLGPQIIRPCAQLVILIALSATVDPALRQERELQRRLRDMLDREAAREGLLGRDETGEGYIKLNFFNLFWVFVITSFLGLVLEEIWHIVIVEPGVWQDRAGILFGPFSPIYGVGAVLLTITLNRFYKKNALAIFIVSAFIGGGFEVFAGWFLQVSFGVVSWNYNHITLFGFPDPIVGLTAGRTCTAFSCMWGLGGLIWIKLLLPRVLAIINKIPWKWRYSLTVVCSALMLVDCFMTLQSLDFWFKRASGTAGDSAVAAFYAAHFDDEYMQNRFQSMSMVGSGTGRVDPKD